MNWRRALMKSCVRQQNPPCLISVLTTTGIASQSEIPDFDISRAFTREHGGGAAGKINQKNEPGSQSLKTAFFGHTRKSY